MEEIAKFAYRANVMPGKVEDNLVELGKWAAAYVESYRGVKVTAATMQGAKADLAHLRKVVDACESERKSLKKAWLKPYEEWQKRYAEAMDPINATIEAIDGQVKEIESAEEAGRVFARKRYIQTMAKAIAERDGLQSIEFDWVWETAWKNKSLLEGKFQQEADAKPEKVAGEIKAIKSMDNAAEILSEYIKDGDMARAVTEAKRSAEAVSKVMHKEEVFINKRNTVEREIPNLETVPKEEQLTISIGRVIRGPKYKIRLALSIMQELGLEIIKPANPMK